MKNNNRLPRIYLNKKILINELIELDKDTTHYLSTVMRIKEGLQIKIFNGFDGEWLAKIVNLEKKCTIIEPLKKVRNQYNPNNLTLIFCLIKSSRLQFVFEKATELGVKNFIPVISEHTNYSNLSIKKAKKWVIEAAEQSQRLEIPDIQETGKLNEVLKKLVKDHLIFFCNESEVQNSLNDIKLQNISKNKKLAVLIGPEGGFSESEKSLLSSNEMIVSIHLGPRILRAETACLAALTIIQEKYGDFKFTRK